MKFVSDGMLGKITRWLRLLGQDVEYLGSIDDRELIQKSKREKRILLTRDRELYNQAISNGVSACFVEGKNEGEKLATLAKRFQFQLEINVEISRCPKCNAKIQSVSKAMIADKIPDATFSHYHEFWECLGCGQVYWRGAHWKGIEKTLRAARKRLRTQI